MSCAAEDKALNDSTEYRPLASLAWAAVRCGAVRTSKNSSRLDEAMHKYLSRSSSGTSGRLAQSSTRSLKARMLWSRSRNWTGGAAAATEAGEVGINKSGLCH